MCFASMLPLLISSLPGQARDMQAVMNTSLMIVMNELFMKEFINSRSKSCEFPLRLFRLMRSWRQNLQPKLKTHNSSLAIELAQGRHDKVQDEMACCAQKNFGHGAQGTVTKA